MQLFILFYCYSIAIIIPIVVQSRQHYTLTTPTCCAPDTVLAKITLGYFQAHKFVCIEPEDARFNATHTHIIGETAPLQGYRIQQSINGTNSTNNIPECTPHVLTIINGETDVTVHSPSCLANVAQHLILISCPIMVQQVEPTPQQQPKLSVIRKCCPINYFYNGNKKKCQLHQFQPFFNVYRELFYYPTAFIDEPIKCPRDRALVEYTLSPEEMYFDDGRLILSKKRKEFKISEYCIEAVLDIATDKIGKSSSDNGQSTFVAGEDVDYLINDDLSLNLTVKNFLVRTCNPIDVCRFLPCIRRCCADGEMFMKGNSTSYCKRDETDISYHSFDSLEISGNFSKPREFGILRGLDCQKFRLDPASYDDEAHTISNRDGSLHVMNTNRNYTNGQYCLEKVRNSLSTDQKLYTFLCFDSKVVGNDRIRFKLYPIGLLISCGFYALTLLVYLCISKLRNLPGKILICLVSSLLLAYFSIALGQLTPTPNDDICFVSGFFIYFCLMAAFAWMNVMCFDIWQAFGSTRKKSGLQKSNTKRFLLYSLYGWGLPTTITTVTILLTRSDLLSDSIRPQFGHGRCWFTYDTLASANLLFFSGPVGVLFLINFILFTMTLRYCNKVKREIFRMQSSNMEKPVLRRRFFVDKARFAMNTKLFIVMGITWVLELLSILLYDHKKTFFWLISDSFNVLLGVSVFFIFVFKKRVWHLILELFGLRPPSNLSKPTGTYATQSTLGTGLSVQRLNTIDGNAKLLTPTPTSTRRSPSFSL